MFLPALVVAGLTLYPGTAGAADQVDVRTPGLRLTAESYDLHVLMLYGILLVLGAVFAVMCYSLYAHRKSAGQFHRSAAFEIIWAVIPFIIVLGAAWPAAGALIKLGDASDADITIRATGLQWKWGYDYVDGLGQGIAFFSNLYAPRRLLGDSPSGPSLSNRIEVDNPVVVPVNRKIRVVMSANDGIHSWHIPALGVKQEAVPGLVRETWFRAKKIGTYRGLCSIEACGAGRACVLIVVNVVSEDDYRYWVESRTRKTAAGFVGGNGARALLGPPGTGAAVTSQPTSASM